MSLRRRKSSFRAHAFAIYPAKFSCDAHIYRTQTLLQSRVFHSLCLKLLLLLLLFFFSHLRLSVASKKLRAHAISFVYLFFNVMYNIIYMVSRTDALFPRAHLSMRALLTSSTCNCIVLLYGLFCLFFCNRYAVALHLYRFIQSG